MEIKNIVFDFGGVVIDWNPEYVYRKVFPDEKERDYFLSEVCNSAWNVQQDAGRPFSEAIREASERFPNYAKEIEMYRSCWIKMIGGAIEKNVSLLDELKKNYCLFGLSNWSAETFPLVYEQYDFFKVFEGIVLSGEEKLIKPDEKIFRVLLSRYEIKAEQSLFIDDSIKNIEAAEALGFNVIHLMTDTDLRKELQALGLL